MKHDLYDFQWNKKCFQTTVISNVGDALPRLRLTKNIKSHVKKIICTI